MEATRNGTVSDWFESPLGSRVLRDESALAPLALDDVFGFELLQMGAWGPARHLLDNARTQHTTLVAPEWAPGVSLCAPLDTLPFRSDSIDAVCLPHTLERVEDPYAVLREAERVLTAEGCLLICGFNPFSGWGARRLFGNYLKRPSFPPSTRRMLSERRLRDWVALLGFDVDSVYGYLGALPMKGRNDVDWHPRAAWMSGAYLLKARKRVPTITMIRPRRARPRVLVATAEQTAKVGNTKIAP